MSTRDEVLACLKHAGWVTLEELRDDLNAARPWWAFWRRLFGVADVLRVLHDLEDDHLVERGLGWRTHFSPRFEVKSHAAWRLSRRAP